MPEPPKTDAETFAWQGFTLSHPPEWAPIALTGDRRAGYIRIASPNTASLQIRWQKSSGHVDLDARLSKYLDRLRRDADKAKRAFKADRKPHGEFLTYHWTGVGQGRGALKTASSCGRSFILEATGDAKDSLMPYLRLLTETFSADKQETERWALLGLDVTLPAGLAVQRKVLLAGQTRLELGSRGVSILVDRWGRGRQLLQAHGLANWSRSALEMPKAQFEETEDGIALNQPRPLRSTRFALVKFDRERNQLVAVRVQSRGDALKPQWDWLR